MNFKSLVKPYIKPMLNELNHLVAIKSVKDPSTITKKTPYGKGVDQALKAFASFGQKNHLQVELTNRYVELSIGNKGPIIEIFGHLDVVPSTKSIFQVSKKGNKLFGRGVADDKGPLLAATYAVIALRDAKLIKNAQIKIFAGGDEECGGSCLESYYQTHPYPQYGFTPDSDFPIVYGEKGIANLKIEKKIKLKNITKIQGGNASNIVISEATFTVDNINQVKKYLKAPHKIKGNAITFYGVAAHGAKPELGKNAFLIGLKELATINHDGIAKKIAESFLDYTGKKLNAYHRGNHLENTVYNVGIASYKNETLTLTINYRYPEGKNPKLLSKAIIKSLDAKLLSENYSGYLLFDLKSPLVSSLMDAYQIETGDKKSKPVILGGGTYAKDTKNTVAFGAQFPHQNYKMHEDNEFINCPDLISSMSIYAHAIYNLMHIKK